ncbi:MAG: hypothetical protein PVJ55_07925 [Anaerolineae bacterium]|jgi:hypothetical protein
MADVSMWQDEGTRQDFINRSKEVLEKIEGKLEGQKDAVIVAVEPESGDYFVGKTLGKANRAAFERYPDQWVYFARLDKPDAAIPLPTW